MRDIVQLLWLAPRQQESPQPGCMAMRHSDDAGGSAVKAGEIGNDLPSLTSISDNQRALFPLKTHGFKRMMPLYQSDYSEVEYQQEDQFG